MSILSEAQKDKLNNAMEALAAAGFEGVEAAETAIETALEAVSVYTADQTDATRTAALNAMENATEALEALRPEKNDTVVEKAQNAAITTLANVTKGAERALTPRPPGEPAWYEELGAGNIAAGVGVLLLGLPIINTLDRWIFKGRDENGAVEERGILGKLLGSVVKLGAVGGLAGWAANSGAGDMVRNWTNGALKRAQKESGELVFGIDEGSESTIDAEEFGEILKKATEGKNAAQIAEISSKITHDESANTVTFQDPALATFGVRRALFEAARD